MICPICKGKRFLLYDAEPFNCALKTPCKRCDGTGNVVPTNFEKITRSPEALAEWLYNNFDTCDSGCSRCLIQSICLSNKERKGTAKDYWLEWLQEGTE